jgi:hypothetical protein
VISGSVTTPKASLIKAYKLIYFKIICQPLTTLGVKQGDRLSPTLFNIFVDDIKSSFIDNTQTKPVSLGVHTFNHLLCADDLVILSESIGVIMELYSFSHLCTDKLSDDGILAFKPKNVFLAF